jgi:hypothetical protein
MGEERGRSQPQGSQPPLQFSRDNPSLPERQRPGSGRSSAKFSKHCKTELRGGGGVAEDKVRIVISSYKLQASPEVAEQMCPLQ